MRHSFSRMQVSQSASLGTGATAGGTEGLVSFSEIGVGIDISDEARLRYNWVFLLIAVCYSWSLTFIADVTVTTILQGWSKAVGLGRLDFI